MRRSPSTNVLMGVVLLCLSTGWGCAGDLARFLRPPIQNIPVTIERFHSKAVELEKQDELRQALFAWRIVAALNPENDDAANAIERLTRHIAEAADRHYQQGVTDYRNGHFDGARLSFRETVRMAPDHQNARYYLKKRLHMTGHATYEVRRGDSFTKIAHDFFKDVSKAYVIAYFNDMDPHRPLLIGTQLVLPELTTDQLLPRRDLLMMLDQAQNALRNGDYAEVLAIAQRIKAQSPGDARAQRLADTAYYRMGMALMDQGHYPAALEALTQISPGFNERDRAILRVRNQMDHRSFREKLFLAEDRLKKGLFMEAIQICRELLEQDPSHTAAKSIFDAAHYAKGKAHLEQGREQEAITSFRMLDKNFLDTGQLLQQAIARRNTRAETHYRQGVMHFLREDLEMAINAWKQCLTLNPDHPKARQDIDNAARLLDKWHRFDQTEGTPKP